MISSSIVLLAICTQKVLSTSRNCAGSGFVVKCGTDNDNFIKFGIVLIILVICSLDYREIVDVNAKCMNSRAKHNTGYKRERLKKTVLLNSFRSIIHTNNLSF